jgi:TonB family protein
MVGLNGERSSGARAESLKPWEGQVLEGLIPLREYIGGDETGAVFLTEFEGQRCAVKVVAAAGRQAEQLLSHWRLASLVSHPHLIRLFKTGRAQLDSTAVAYVVMEYAEENLGQALAERALSPGEARDMLGPALDAIAWVHREGYVHGRLTPAHILAVDDCLKLSSDNLRRIGDADDLPALPGAWRPPESGKLSPTGDMWTLGVTLVEALTQQPPAWIEGELVLPDGVNGLFPDIVRRCLRPNAPERSTAGEIGALLKEQAPAPKKSRKGWYGVGAAVVATAIVAVWFGLPSQESPRPGASPVTAVSPVAKAPVQAPVESGPPPSAPAASAPTASVKPELPASRDAAPPASSPQAAEPDPPAAAPDETAPVIAPASPDIVSQVMPEVLASARQSIHGKVNVNVRVHADAYGSVREVTPEPPSVSRYFTGATVKAVRRWKFRPVRDGETYVPQQWTVRMEYTRSDTKIAVQRVAP